jgi:predicted metal-binding membrane protein
VGPVVPVLRDAARRWRQWHPEWPVAALAAAAWAALVAGAVVQAGGLGGDGGPAALHHHHPGAGPGVLAQLPAWMLMTLAMMLPVALPGFNYVAHNSLRTRQRRAMGLFLAGFLAPWLPLGVAAAAAYGLAVDRLGVGRQVVLWGSLAAAAAWQLTRTKRRALLACARTVPLPPRGARADVACLRFGWLHAWRCLRSCWAVMLVMVPAGHGLAWMAVITGVVLAEQRHPRALTLAPAR